MHSQIDVSDLQVPPELKKDLKNAALVVAPNEVRVLVGLYYDIQEHRLRTQSQVRAAGADEKPHATIQQVAGYFHDLERAIPPALGRFAASRAEGVWLQEVYGIGPVLSAGMISGLRTGPLPEVPTKWYKFCGLAPGQRRTKGKKLDFDPFLKTLCWKLGDSFVKLHNKPACFYGKLYERRKAYEAAKNAAGDYADQARAILAGKNVKDAKLKAFLEAGRLSDGHIDNRARRWAVKMLLSHFHYVCYKVERGIAPPLPFAIAHGGHADWIAPPHPELIP